MKNTENDVAEKCVQLQRRPFPKGCLGVSTFELWHVRIGAENASFFPIRSSDGQPNGWFGCLVPVGVIHALSSFPLGHLWKLDPGTYKALAISTDRATLPEPVRHRHRGRATKQGSEKSGEKEELRRPIVIVGPLLDHGLSFSGQLLIAPGSTRSGWVHKGAATSSRPVSNIVKDSPKAKGSAVSVGAVNGIVWCKETMGYHARRECGSCR